jgi:hypothetical protein
MVEAYKIGIGISISGNVNAVLNTIIRQFGTANAAAQQLHNTLNKIKLIGAAGGAVAGVGFLGLDLLKKTIDPAREYAHQLNLMTEAGMEHLQIVQATQDAWKETNKIMTIGPTEYLKEILDLRNVLVSQERERYGAALPAVGTPARAAIETADWATVRAAGPMVAMVQAGLMSAQPKLFGQGGPQQDYAWQIAKALDIRTAATDPQRFQREMQEMGRVAIATQGRVNPATFASAMFYLRQAAPGASEQFLYGILPSLLLEAPGGAGGVGGGQHGIAPMVAAGYRAVIQGTGIQKKNLPILQALGLVRPGAQPHQPGGFVDPNLFIANQYEWVQKYVAPAIQKFLAANKLPATTQNIQQMAAAISGGGASTWTALLGQYLIKPPNFMRDVENIQKAMFPAQAYQYGQQNDLESQLQAAATQWQKFQIQIGTKLLPVLIPLIGGFARNLDSLIVVMQNNPGVVKDLTLAFAGLSATLLFGGTVTALGAAFKGLSVILGLLKFAPLASLTSAVASLTGLNLGVAAVSITGVAGALAALAAVPAISGATMGLLQWLDRFVGGKGATGLHTPSGYRPLTGTGEMFGPPVPPGFKALPLPPPVDVRSRRLQEQHAKDTITDISKGAGQAVWQELLGTASKAGEYLWQSLFPSAMGAEMTAMPNMVPGGAAFANWPRYPLEPGIAGLVEQYESGGRNVPNYRYDPGHTASGLWQITDSTWRQYANLVPGAALYKHALDAPEDIQRQMFNAIWQRDPGAWLNYDMPLASALMRGDASMKNVRLPAFAAPMAVSGGEQSGPYQGIVAEIHKVVDALMALLTKPITVSGTTQLTGNVELNVPGFTKIIGDVVARGIQQASGSLSGAPARPDISRSLVSPH